MKKLFKSPYFFVSALLIGGGFTIAMNNNDAQPLVFEEYDVSHIEGGNYVIGTPPSCGDGSAVVCKIRSPFEPVNDRIPMSSSVIPLDWRQTSE